MDETADKMDFNRMFEVIHAHNLEFLDYHAHSERLFTNKINAIFYSFTYMLVYTRDLS